MRYSKRRRLTGKMKSIVLKTICKERENSTKGRIATIGVPSTLKTKHKLYTVMFGDKGTNYHVTAE